MVMNIMGVFNIRAPYFSFLFIIPGLYLGGNTFYNMSGYIMGHVYYFFDDVMPNLPFMDGFRLFKAPPVVWKACKVLGMECTRELVLEAGDFIVED